MTIRHFRRRVLLSAVAVIVLVPSAACGASGSGSDESYVAAVCRARKTFIEEMKRVGMEISAALYEDFSHQKVSRFKEGEINGRLGQPVGALAASMAQAKPPSDLESYHNEVVKTMKASSANMKEGKSGSLRSFSDIPRLPTAAHDRLQQVAAKTKDCTESDWNFGDW